MILGFYYACSVIASDVVLRPATASPRTGRLPSLLLLTGASLVVSFVAVGSRAVFLY